MYKMLGNLGGERIRVAGLAACCNYFSKKKKKLITYVKLHAICDSTNKSPNKLEYRGG